MENQTNLETVCRKILSELPENGFFGLSMKNWIADGNFVTAIDMFGILEDELLLKYLSPETIKELREIYSVLKQIEP